MKKLTEEALGGLSAGIVGTVIGYPLDLVKTRMQTTIEAQHKGIFQVGYGVVRKEGFLALYKGMAPPLISLSILNTLNFSSYSFFRNLYHAERGWDVRNAFAGMTGGPFGSMVSTVENFVKTQMQVDNVSEKKFRGSVHCTTHLLEKHGIRVLYTGHVINTSREAGFLGVYFYTYEGFREVLLHTAQVKPTLAVPIAGGLSGAISWFVTFPLDCIRAVLQGRPISSPSSRPTSLDVFRELVQKKGFMGLYSGVAPSILRAFLVSGSRFSAYEGALWLIRYSGVFPTPQFEKQ